MARDAGIRYYDTAPHLGLGLSEKRRGAAPITRPRTIADVRTAHGTALPAAATAFPYGRPSIIDVTLGMRSPEQVARYVELRRRHIPEGLWDDLRAQELIRSDVPADSGHGRSSRCH
ncbi:hypothetical protein [Streptomyces sp. NBC_00459]|uniref:hypothetical protein n=1 Tax=Streptomyces sp. NBC_00459 TaxID=2975749 RepID=UPI002E18E92F